MWRLLAIDNPGYCRLWFSDGQPIPGPRGGQGVSSRLIVQDQGFLDVTELDLCQVIVLDANRSKLVRVTDPGSAPGSRPGRKTHGTGATASGSRIVDLDLRLPGDGTFTLCTHKEEQAFDASSQSVQGRLKPLPKIAQDDVRFMESMISQGYVPYRNLPDGQGKSREEITLLGKVFFPFSTASFELAMCVYDWTTASFARMVFLKIFEYTTYDGVGQPPIPVDQASVAEMIWKSNWPPYTAQDPDFMSSFMMKPSWSQLEVELQLIENRAQLHRFSDVENRLLAAAVEALPRASVLLKPRLFSGQVDMQQLGRDRFGIEFLEYPGNKGPICNSLVYDYNAAISSYVSIGNIVTTKMVWSFTDNPNDAMHYPNGILLIAEPPEEAWVWEGVAYVTPLSDDPKKTEYTFVPGTKFMVKSMKRIEDGGRVIDVITLQVQPGQATTPAQAPAQARTAATQLGAGFDMMATRERLMGENTVPLADALEKPPVAVALPHTPGRTGGRRCSCTGPRTDKFGEKVIEGVRDG